MDVKRSRWRRRLQFRLRSLLTAVLVIAAVLAVWRIYVADYFAQRSAIKTFERLGVRMTIEPADAPRWVGLIVGRDNLVKVTQVRCQSNYFQGRDCSLLARAIGKAKWLRGASLRAAFTDEHLMSFGRARSLEYLSLENTQIRGHGIASLQAAGSLRIVFLRNATEFTDVGLANLPNPDDLMCLHVTRSKITDAGLRSISNSPLACLWLANCRITDAGLKRLSRLEGLVSLCLDETQVGDDGMRVVSHCKQLNELYLSDTRVTSQGVGLLRGLEKLNHLALCGLPIDDRCLGVIGRLHRLRTLDLSRTFVTGAGLSQLREIEFLRMLRLRGTLLSDETASGLLGLPQRVTVDVTGTNVSGACLARIKAARPDLRIEGNNPMPPRRSYLCWR